MGILLKKDELQSWVSLELVERFTGRMLEFDLDMALCWGKIQGEAERSGEKLPVMDSLIAATAVAHGLVVVTRKARDIERCGGGFGIRGDDEFVPVLFWARQASIRCK